eukprot:8184983-Pyramimonas_sp.AAC.1
MPLVFFTLSSRFRGLQAPRLDRMTPLLTPPLPPRSDSGGPGHPHLGRAVPLLLLPRRVRKFGRFHRRAVREAVQAGPPLPASEAPPPRAPRPPRHQVPGAPLAPALGIYQGWPIRIRSIIRVFVFHPTYWPTLEYALSSRT